jgi:hypothetical protein
MSGYVFKAMRFQNTTEKFKDSFNLFTVTVSIAQGAIILV